MSSIGRDQQSAVLTNGAGVPFGPTRYNGLKIEIEIKAKTYTVDKKIKAKRLTTMLTRKKRSVSF